jgi:hypothetical protein
MGQLPIAFIENKNESGDYLMKMAFAQADSESDS